MVNKIEVFNGEWHFLSNFYLTDIEYEGLTYPSVEHAYQAAKTEIWAERLQFTARSLTPGRAKRLGRGLTLRPNWGEIKLKVMKDLLNEKFYFVSSLGSLSLRLLATDNAELIEGNTWGDTFWGVCRGVGENHLGKLLMERREELRLCL